MRRILTAAVLAVGLVTFAGLGQAQEKKPAGDPVREAVSAGIFEVKSSDLARERASSPEVNRFAQRMIEDYLKSNMELKGIIERGGLEIPLEMTAKCKEKYARLAALRGAAFDKEYVEIQVRGHEEAVKLFEELSKNATNADLKQFATSVLPTLRQNKEHAMKLPGADKVRLGDKR
jgi:putative membrane protein